MKIQSGLIVALAAGSIAGIAQAGELERTAMSPSGHKSVHGYVYANGLTGERVISYTSAGSVNVRGAGWAWDSSYADPCFPASVSTDPADQVFWVTATHDAATGDAVPADPFAAWAWQDWVEHPGDSIINLISFGLFTQVEDPEEDGVVGQEMLLVLTENDRAPSRSGAVASTVVTFTDLPGANDENGDGIIDFAEGNLWVMVFDLAAQTTPFDIEIGDTNGVYDGAYPNDGLFGVPGSDVDGDGMIDSGFVVAWRQPNVAEGDQLIVRFPELAGLGLENPDGLDVNTFPNIANLGPALVHPSEFAGVEGEPNCYDPNAAEWPQVAGCDDAAPAPMGSWDAFGLIDATGTDAGAFWFGGFSCLPLPDPNVPPYNNPWANMMISFNVDLIGAPACPCDMNGDGILDLSDIGAFVTAFQAGDLAADINGDGILDLGDISGFVTCFQAGCP